MPCGKPKNAAPTITRSITLKTHSRSNAVKSSCDIQNYGHCGSEDMSCSCGFLSELTKALSINANLLLPIPLLLK